MESSNPHLEAPAAEATAFLCECGNSLCPSRVWLTPAAYERTRLVVAPGHERWRPAAPGRACRRAERDRD